MLKIYHNPRCRKSREGLAILENSGKEFEVILYLQDNPDESELGDIIKKLGISADKLVRKNEAIWKEQFKGKEMSEAEIIAAMAANPKLIERPIVLDDDRAVIGRPPELINDFI